MSNTPAGDEPARIRPFADVLLELSKGRVHAELSAELQRVIAAVADVRKAGTLTLTLKVVPDKGTDQLRVSATVGAKVPARDRESLFFLADDGNLTRDDPTAQRRGVQLVMPDQEASSR